MDRYRFLTRTSPDSGVHRTAADFTSKSSTDGEPSTWCLMVTYRFSTSIPLER
jgi:hypothetical protein